MNKEKTAGELKDSLIMSELKWTVYKQLLDAVLRHGKIEIDWRGISISEFKEPGEVWALATKHGIGNIKDIIIENNRFILESERINVIQKEEEKGDKPFNFGRSIGVIHNE